MMLREANELKDTAVLRIFQKQGMEVKTEGIINAVTKSQTPTILRATGTVPLEKNHKSKPSGPDPATLVASPTVPFQGFQFTTLETPKPNKTGRSPQGGGPQSELGPKLSKLHDCPRSLEGILRTGMPLVFGLCIPLMVIFTMGGCFVFQPESSTAFFKSTTPQPGIVVSRLSLKCAEGLNSCVDPISEKNITKIRKDCQTSQSGEVPNLIMASPRHISPVIEGFM